MLPIPRVYLIASFFVILVACWQSINMPNLYDHARIGPIGEESRMEISTVADTGDTLTEKAARESERAQYRALFSKFSRVAPTPENLREALLQADAQGEVATQVIAALNLISLADPEEKFAAYVLLSYIRNPTNWTIRGTSVRALLQINESHGVLLARAIFTATDAPLDAKLLVATYLLKVGKLDGYSVLRKGLESGKAIERRLADDLATGFKKFNGQIDPFSGEKIDVEELIRSATKKKEST